MSANGICAVRTFLSVLHGFMLKRASNTLLHKTQYYTEQSSTTQNNIYQSSTIIVWSSTVFVQPSEVLIQSSLVQHSKVDHLKIVLYP